MKIIVKRYKFDWYWVPLLFLVWSILFVSIIWWHQEDLLPAKSHTFPEDGYSTDEAKGFFLQQRSRALLSRYEKLGAKVVGSSANEQATVQFLLNEVKQIKMLAHQNLYEIQEEVSYGSDSFVSEEDSILNYYQGIQYLVIRVRPQRTQENGNLTESTLLINCHYDTVSGSSGAGSSGAMVVVLLETLRNLLQSDEEPLKHSLIFLFNGAKENELQGIHAFMAHHRWALRIKAAINLDSFGNGGKEMMIRAHSSNGNFWLLKYYRQNALNPFASSFIEELVQQQWLPLRNDYDLLRSYKPTLSLLDISYVYGGHFYHTQFDHANVIPKATVERTTGNLLALIRAIANAPELDEIVTEKLDNDQHVFFDVFGLFMISYTSECAIWLNVGVSLVYLSLLLVFIWLTAPNTGLKRHTVLLKFIIILAIQWTSVLLALIVTVLVMCLLDIVDVAMIWYAKSWFTLGLYAAPMLFVMGILPAIFLSRTKDHGLPLSYAVQLFMHSHCLLLIIIALLALLLGIRSSFIVTFCSAFYTLSMMINIFTYIHKTNFLWFICHTICLIVPFAFCTYCANILYSILIPITGYQATSTNPQILIGGIAIAWCLLVGGFVLPSLYLFRKAKTIISTFMVVWIVSIILGATSIGFPYEPKMAVQRIYVQHTDRIIHNDDPAMTISREETGFVVIPLVKRHSYLLDHSFGLNFNRSISESRSCEDDFLCGFPIYNPRWLQWQEQALWLPANTLSTSKYQRPNLRIISKAQISSQRIMFTLEVFGPDHISIFIKPLPTVRLIGWSLSKELLQSNRWEWFYVYYSYALDASPFRFSMEFEHQNADWSGVTFHIALIGHQMHNEINYSKEFRELLFRLPSWTHVTAWISSYEMWKL